MPNPPDHASETKGAATAAGMDAQYREFRTPLSGRWVHSFFGETRMFHTLPMRADDPSALDAGAPYHPVPPMFLVARSALYRACAAIGRALHHSWAPGPVIDHKTIGSGDEPEHVCQVVDVRPLDYVSEDLRDTLAFYRIYQITKP